MRIHTLGRFSLIVKGRPLSPADGLLRLNPDRCWVDLCIPGDAVFLDLSAEVTVMGGILSMEAGRARPPEMAACGQQIQGPIKECTFAAGLVNRPARSAKLTGRWGASLSARWRRDSAAPFLGGAPARW